MAIIRTQDDIVRDFLSQEEKIITEKLRLPAVEQLHLRRPEEIAEVWANVILKSRKNILEIKWVLGEYIEVTYKD